MAPYLGSNPFMLTYCDGLADVDLDRLLAFHTAHGRLVTLTAIHPQARFGGLSLNGDRVAAFQEKVVDPNHWVNGGYFVLSPKIFDYIAGDSIQWEREPLADLAAAGELMAYRHENFWQCMDTLPESILLNDLWHTGKAPGSGGRRPRSPPEWRSAAAPPVGARGHVLVLTGDLAMRSRQQAERQGRGRTTIGDDHDHRFHLPQLRGRGGSFIL